MLKRNRITPPLKKPCGKSTADQSSLLGGTHLCALHPGGPAQHTLVSPRLALSVLGVADLLPKMHSPLLLRSPHKPGGGGTFHPNVSRTLNLSLVRMGRLTELYPLCPPPGGGGGAPPSSGGGGGAPPFCPAGSYPCCPCW